MHTYVDFITHVKGIEYIISVLAIVGFILFLEILKPKPFETFIQSTQDDLDHMRKTGYEITFRTVKRMFAAPFIGLFYVLMLPFIFVYALGSELFRIAAQGYDGLMETAGKFAFFGWRPMEAYFGGKKGRKGRKEEQENQKAAESETVKEEK
jgi:hypothetical protein